MLTNSVMGTFNGFQLIESPHIPLETYAHEIPEVRFSHSSSHREWKRLVRERRKLAKAKTRRDVLVMGNKMFIHPEDAKALREATATPETRPKPKPYSVIWPSWGMQGIGLRGVNSIFRTDGVG